MFIVCLILLIFSAVYDPYLIRKLIGRPKKGWPLQLLALLFIVGYFTVIVSRSFLEANVFWAIVYDILGLCFIFQVYLFFYLRLFQLVLFIKKRLQKSQPLIDKKPSSFVKSAVLFGLGLCAGLVLYGAIQARFFTVTEYEIVLPGLEKPVTLAHVPDLHLGDSRGKAYLESVLEVIKAKNPDLVWYNGDLVDSKLALRDEVFDLFKTVGIEQYFTTGNHEYYVGTDLVIDWVKKAGIKVLRSEMVLTHGIQMIGLEYMNADSQSADAHQVNQLIMEDELPKIQRSSALPLVVVHHSPVGMKYVQAAGAAAMLSGHTHGGQVFPGNVIIKSRFPMYKGRYLIDNMTLIVSQGAGTFGPMMRLGSSNEIQFITFVPEPAGSS
jgi:predicted MPP superfamily phosphohydrolase